MKIGGYRLWPTQTGGVINVPMPGTGPGANRLLFTQEGIALSTVVNTAATTAFTTPFTPPIVTANLLSFKGAMLTFSAWGIYANTGTPTILFACKFDDATSGGSPPLGNAAFTLPNNTVGAGWIVNYGLVVRTAGSSGVYGTMSGSTILGSDGAAILGRAWAALPAPGASLDTTVSHTIELAVTWGAADPANTITLQGAAVSIAYPVIAA